MTPCGPNESDADKRAPLSDHDQQRPDPKPTGFQAQPVMDDRDIALIHQRLDAFDEREGPRVGDYVRFADGVLRRISYHWTDGAGWDGGCQTSDGGFFHLNDTGCSFSGSLYPTVPTDSLSLTDERLDGAAWIFHHNQPQAHNDVYFTTAFRVYECAAHAPS